MTQPNFRYSGNDTASSAVLRIHDAIEPAPNSTVREYLVKGIRSQYEHAPLFATFQQDTRAFWNARYALLYGQPYVTLQSEYEKAEVFLLGGALALHSNLPNDDGKKQRLLVSEARPALQAGVIRAGVEVDEVLHYQRGLDIQLSSLHPRLRAVIRTAARRVCPRDDMIQQKEFNRGYVAMHRTVAEMLFTISTDHSLASPRKFHLGMPPFLSHQKPD